MMTHHESCLCGELAKVACISQLLQKGNSPCTVASRTLFVISFVFHLVHAFAALK